MNDGGPAFPRPASQTPHGLSLIEQDGMSLLDWYAGQAMAGMLAGASGRANSPTTRRRTAERAYSMAEIMIEEKGKVAARALAERRRLQKLAEEHDDGQG